MIITPPHVNHYILISRFLGISQKAANEVTAQSSQGGQEDAAKEETAQSSQGVQEDAAKEETAQKPQGIQEYAAKKETAQSSDYKTGTSDLAVDGNLYV